jgi:hypothetical protein
MPSCPSRAALVLSACAAAAPAVAGAQLRGTVVTAAGGRPVVGAYVAVRRQGAGADTAVVGSARADTAGAFLVRGLRPAPTRSGCAP